MELRLDPRNGSRNMERKRGLNMDKKDIKKMLDGIRDEYLEEAVENSGVERKHKGGKTVWWKAAVAAAVCMVILGGGVSVYASNHLEGKPLTMHNLIQSFRGKEVTVKGGKGISIEKQTPTVTASQTPDSGDPAAKGQGEVTKKYLRLAYIPKGYHITEEGTSIYYGKNQDTDFFTVAFFHLQETFVNILPQAEKMDHYRVPSGEVYVAKNQHQTRAWILFDGNDYLLELRDDNNNLTEKQIRKLMEGASLSDQKPKIMYQTLEWTKEQKQSYEKWLKTYAQ